MEFLRPPAIQPERQPLLDKLNASTKLRVLARDASSGNGSSCSVPRAAADCTFILAVTPITTTTSSYIPPIPTQTTASDYAPQPSPAVRYAQQQQQEPLDQASVRYQVFENGNCRLVAVKNLSKLQTSSGPPSKDSIEWLTSKIVEGVATAISRDRKRQHP